MADPDNVAPPPGFTLDEAPPPGFTVDQPATQAAADQPDNAAPDASGFTDDQKQAIIDYLPKASDAADLERFSREVSGGKAHIGNAQKVLDYLKKGGKPEDFAFGNPTYEAPKPGDKPKQADPLHIAIGNSILQQLNAFMPGLGTLLQFAGQQDAAYTLGEHAANELPFGYGPEISGATETALDPSQWDDFKANLDRNVAHNRAQSQGDAANHPVAAVAGDIGGVALNSAISGGAAEAANLGRGAKIAQLLAESGLYGSGDAGPGHRLEGAAAGTALGAAVPVVGKVAGAVAGAVKQGAKLATEGSPGIARRIIAKAIKDDANTPESVGQTIADAQSKGVPMVLGDTGENVRGLMAATSRASGASRTIVRDALNERQSGLSDRVESYIERDLGPVANPHEVADTLSAKAKADSAPLYEAAYNRPGAQSFGDRMAPLLQRPSMQKAITKAYRIAKEEGRDPETLGFQYDPVTDEATVKKVPSWQTLDYIKRGMDDVVEGYRDNVTGKLNLDTEGRAINNTLRSYLGAFDKANPDYAAARAAYAGPAREQAAMDLGRKALNMTADDLEARMRGLSDSEREMAKLGLRRAMVERVQEKGDTADIVHALTGSGKKRAMLARVFGDRKTFQRFVDTLGHEREAWRSFKTAQLGSPTAANQMDDATLAAVTGGADLLLTGGVPIATATGQAVKFLGRQASKKAQEHVAALLSNPDPMAIRELAAHLRAEAEHRGINVPKFLPGLSRREASAVVGKQVGQ